QLILAGESHLDFVADPAAGSGAIAALTDRLCETAWAEFRRIEAEGGLLSSLSRGLFQERVRVAREARTRKFVEKERAIVGTTIFPASVERPVSTLDAVRRASPTEGTVFCEQMPASRID